MIQDPNSNHQFAIPNKLLKKASSWSESSSNPGSDSKNVNNENYMPKSKAVKGKFIFDPEHGGGRRRRDRKLQRITQEPNEDKIGYDHIKDFKRRID